MFKLWILILFIGVSSPLWSWCENGTKVRQDWIMGGGYKVLYSFPNGRTLLLRYETTQKIDVYIRYDFDQMRFCQ